jgi:hypothetical protein
MRVSVRQNCFDGFGPASGVFLHRAIRGCSNSSRPFSTWHSITPTLGDEPSKGCGLGRSELSSCTNQANDVVTASGIHLAHEPP